MIKILAKSGSLPTSRDFDFSGEGRLVAGELNLKDIFISIYNTQIPKMLSTSKMTLEDERLEKAPVEIDFITEPNTSLVFWLLILACVLIIGLNVWWFMSLKKKH